MDYLSSEALPCGRIHETIPECVGLSLEPVSHYPPHPADRFSILEAVFLAQMMEQEQLVLAGLRQLREPACGMLRREAAERRNCLNDLLEGVTGSCYYLNCTALRSFWLRNITSDLLFLSGDMEEQYRLAAVREQSLSKKRLFTEFANQHSALQELLQSGGMPAPTPTPKRRICDGTL